MDTFNFNGGSLSGNADGAGNDDTFNVNVSFSVNQLIGNAGNDTFKITGNSVLSTPSGTTVVIDGGADNDEVQFGTPTGSPPGADTSTLVGSVDLGAGSDTIDYSGSSLVQLLEINTVVLGEQSGTIGGFSAPPDLIGPSPANGFAGVNNFIGNSLGTLIGPPGPGDTYWHITSQDTGTYGPTLAAIATNNFTAFNIQAQGGDDYVIFDVTGQLRGDPLAPVGTITGFNGGGFVTGNFLMGSIGNDIFDIEGAMQVDATTPTGARVTQLLNITDIDSNIGGGTFTDAGADTFNFAAAWGGSIMGGPGSDTINTATAVTAEITSIAPASLTSATNSFTGTGFFEIEILNTGAGADVITLTVAPTDTTDANQLNLGAGSDTIISQVAADWLIDGNNAGFVRDPGNTLARVRFTGVENLTATANSVLDMPNTGFSIGGTFTAPQVTLTANTNIGATSTGFIVGALGLRINAVNGVIGPASPPDATGNLAIAATGGGINLTGPLTVDGTFSSGSGGGGTANYLSVTSGGSQNYAGTTFINGDVTATVGALTFNNAVSITGDATSTGNQTYGGATQLGGDLSGANLVFNGVTNFSGNVLLSSSTDIWDFNNQVTSGTADVLNIVPTTVPRDIFIDLTDGAGHISANKFGGFLGFLSIGAEFVPGTTATPVFDGQVLSLTSTPAGVAPNADQITIAEPFETGGNILIIGSNIDFAPTTVLTDIVVAAGAAGQGDVALIALGDQLVAANDGLGADAATGFIRAPDNDTITIRGGGALFAATDAVENSDNIILDLANGPILLTQSSTADSNVSFNVQSNANTNSGINTDSLSILQGIADLIQAGGSFSSVTGTAQTTVSIFNPAAVLTILRLFFLDSSAFEEELTLFGIIGEGIAQSLEQCEEAEGCAPTVTEEELEAFIVEIKRRIEFLDQEVAADAIDLAEAQNLKERLQIELANFEQYRVQLAEYNARQEALEFGDDAGFDFDDVFEAEEVLEPVEVEPVEEIPEFEPIEQPADIEAEIPADEFEDIDEALETLEEPAAVETTPEVTPEPETIDLDEEPVFDDSDFEEFEEELDDSLTNDLMKRDRVNEFAGAVRLDRFGNVEWQGAVVLPTLHRRF